MRAMANVVLATPDARAYDSFAPEIEGEGHTVFWAVDGKEAYDLALEHSPALVMLETSLSIFDGYETCKLLRDDPEVAREVAIYLISDDDLNVHKVAKCGATGVFPKTHQYHEIRELLTE